MSAYSDSFECESSSSSLPSSSKASVDPSKSPHEDSPERSPETDSGALVAAEESGALVAAEESGGTEAPRSPVKLEHTLAVPLPKLSSVAPSGYSIDSVDTLGSHAERKLDARLAPEKRHFRKLEKFVAFGDASFTYSAASETDRPSLRASEVAESLPVGDAWRAEAMAKLRSSGEKRDEDTSEGSAFSTLSQHLVRQGMQRATAGSMESEQPAQLAKGLKHTLPLRAWDLAPPVATSEDAAAGSAPVGLPRRLGIELSPASLAAKFPPASVPAEFPPASVPAEFPPASVPAEFPPASVPAEFPPASVPAALPPAPSPLPPSAAPNARVAELRETSEAVERLVRAFALLRGHPVQSREVNDPASFTSRDTASMRTAHGVGDAQTLRFRQRPPTRAASRSLKTETESRAGDAAAAAQANTCAAEEAICSLVVEMLQSRGARGPASSPAAVDRIGMDEFRVSAGTSRTATDPSARRDRPLSVFDGELRAFAPGDADAADALRKSIRCALDRYVSTHVVQHARIGSCGTPVTASFAWALQLDLLAVCMRALETQFDLGTRAGPRGGGQVWIRYDGPREAEFLARNAVHCLPFEALDARGGGSLMFRMEYWVTRDKLFIVADALASSVRDGIAASADVYVSLCGDGPRDSAAAAEALLPPRAPLFALHPAGPPGRAAPESGTARGAPECFGMEPAAVEAVAHAVSAAATEIVGTDARGGFDEQYRDATSAVATAVCELLRDESIRAAVTRRARAKVDETQRRRGEDTRMDRSAKERAMIDAAEEEAERVVQRIMQEMRVEAGTRA